MLSTKVSIALQGTGSFSYQRKMIIRACSHTITQEKNLRHTRTFAEKNQAQHIIRQKKHQSFPLYISSIATRTCCLPLRLHCGLSFSSHGGPNLTSIRTHPIPYSTHAPQISARRSWSLFCFCPSFILLSCVTQSKRKC